jgi:hypothetical protein
MMISSILGLVHAKSEDPAIVQWGFDYLLKTLSDRSPPHLISARGAAAGQQERLQGFWREAG